ncbi:ATP-binding protein [Candidatus Saganbacteria bacterium]|nr:ATP-binding protein [Candidatus Saganbacteria bacterium]
MQGKNKHILRYLEIALKGLIKKRYSALILGPRQVGKTTAVQACLKMLKNRAEYPLQDPSLRIELESNPGRIINQVRALPKRPYVFIDEAQKVPEIFDSVQLLIDNRDAQFILTGSSARKLRRHAPNLLPGRVEHFHMDPLLWGELGLIKDSTILPIRMENLNASLPYSFEENLTYGSLPRIVTLPKKDRNDFLKSYGHIYLEEEIRAEALSRKIGAFSRFLELAAEESGSNPNFTKLSNESGVSQPAIKEFYNILEDTLIIERVDPFLKSARKRILSSSRYYFFDIGVRNALARAPLSRGMVFEHAVMLEIIRRIRALKKNYGVYYWKTSGGAEVDCILDLGNKVIPIEIKSSSYVTHSELKGLKIFLEDYKKFADQGYVITMGKRKEKITDNITALPWFYL